MSKADFEADASGEGCGIRDGKIEPHVHDRDARRFVLESAFTLIRGN